MKSMWVFWLSSLVTVATIGLGYFYRKQLRLVSLAWKFRRAYQQGDRNQFELLPSGQAAKISYWHHGRPQVIYVPYRRTRSGHQVYLITDESGDNSFEITQARGIPYLVTAEDLGGDRIVVTDRRGRSETFASNEYPSI